MTLDEFTAKLSKANAVIPGKRLRIDYGEQGSILLDGVANTVSGGADGEADTTIAINWDDWLALASGTLDPMAAFMQGKLRIQGDMGLAMQVQTLFARLKG